MFFIIAQGPKGEGMINSMNGACDCGVAVRAGWRLAPPQACADASSACGCALSESRMFGNFTQTKNIVSTGTWALVGAFLLLSALTALKH